MSTGIRDMVVLVAALVAAVGAETLFWVLLAKTSTQQEQARNIAGVLAMLVLGAIVFAGPARLGPLERALVTAVSLLGYAYLRARIHLPIVLARLGTGLAQKSFPRVADLRARDPRKIRREQRLTLVGVAITLVAPIIGAILYSETRRDALVWAIIVVIPATVVLWRWFVHLRGRT